MASWGRARLGGANLLASGAGAASGIWAKETGLGRHPLTKKGKLKMKMKHTHEIVASRMKKGELNELRQICEIGKVLQDMGKSNVEINHFMNVDRDFITDVLSCYKWEAERFASRTI